MAVYEQDQDTDLDGLEQSFHGPDAANSGSKKLNDTKSIDADNLAQQEASPESIAAAGQEVGLRGGEENPLDKLNKGYTGGGGKKTAVSKLFNSNSKLKKRVAIAGAVAGGSAIAGVFAFIALLPLELRHIVANIEHKYAAAAVSSIDQEAGNMLSRYVGRSILPSILAGTCHSTIDASCVVVPEGTGPLGRMYKAWSDGNLEYKLATQFGIVLGKEGNDLYMSVHGEHIGNAKQFQDLRAGKISIFDLDGTKNLSRTEIRSYVKNALKESTLWDRTYTRFKVGKLLEAKYGIKRCVIACKTKDKIAHKLAVRQLASQSYMLQRLLPEKYGLVLTCVLAGATGNCDPTKLDTAESGDNERLSPFQKQLQEQLASYAAKFGESSLEDLSKLAQDISKNGLKEIVARKAIGSIVGTLGGDAAGVAAGQLAEKAVPVVGWVLLGTSIISGAALIGPLLQHAAYAMNSATSVEAYQVYKTVAAECTTQHCDPAELGSFTHALQTNLSGSSENSVDFSQSPLWQSDFGQTSSPATASILGSVLSGRAFADGTASSTYKCDDGNPVPAGKLVCAEENFADDGSKAANAVSGIATAIPGLAEISTWITKIGNTPSDWIAKGLSLIPGYDSFTAWATSGLTGPLNWVENQLITAPDINSGARQVDMMMAGADAASNASCQIQLGCPLASDQAMADLWNEQKAEQKAEFQSLPLFARVFSTNSPYSLLSRLAMTMPTSLSGATSAGLASLLTNPFQRLGLVVSSTFASNTAFAATTAQPDPFGIPQHRYLSSQIPSNPQSYWDANCVHGPLALYDDATDKLDVSLWLNQQELDPKTGEAVAKTPNACLLIQTSYQSLGVLFDISLAPKDSTNSDETAL